MMARRVPGILPPLSFDEALEVTAIHSVAGLLPPGAGLIADRPFRAPHHTISNAALIGGGSQPRPGEVSLAHHGVLFLDEMLEFSRHVLEVLRQPLEEGRVAVARAARTAVFPARFMLVGAMNPCPCGFAGDPSRECRCTPPQIARYRERLSGPLRDRLDLTVEVPALPLDAMSTDRRGRAVRGRARAGRSPRGPARRERYAPDAASPPTPQLTPSLMAAYCGMDGAALRVLQAAMTRMSLSARGYDRVRKVATHDRRPCRRRARARRPPRRGLAVPDARLTKNSAESSKARPSLLQNSGPACGGHRRAGAHHHRADLQRQEIVVLDF